MCHDQFYLEEAEAIHDILHFDPLSRKQYCKILQNKCRLPWWFNEKLTILKFEKLVKWHKWIVFITNIYFCQVKRQPKSFFFGFLKYRCKNRGISFLQKKFSGININTDFFLRHCNINIKHTRKHFSMMRTARFFVIVGDRVYREGRVSRGKGVRYTHPTKRGKGVGYTHPPKSDMGPEIPYPVSRKNMEAEIPSPTERTWDQGSGRNLAPEVPYPSPPSEQNDWQTLVKTLPSHNFVGGR